FYESSSHLLHDKFVTKSFYSIQFSLVPGTFQELQHENAHSLADRSQCSAHRSSSLPFSWSCVDKNQSATNVWHGFCEFSNSCCCPGGKPCRAQESIVSGFWASGGWGFISKTFLPPFSYILLSKSKKGPAPPYRYPAPLQRHPVF